MKLETLLEQLHGTDAPIYSELTKQSLSGEGAAFISEALTYYHNREDFDKLNIKIPPRRRAIERINMAMLSSGDERKYHQREAVKHLEAAKKFGGPALRDTYGLLIKNMHSVVDTLLDIVNPITIAGREVISLLNSEKTEQEEFAKKLIAYHKLEGKVYSLKLTDEQSQKLSRITEEYIDGLFKTMNRKEERKNWPELQKKCVKYLKAAEIDFSSYDYVRNALKGKYKPGDVIEDIRRKCSRSQLF